MEGLSIRLRLTLAHTLVFGVLLGALSLGLYQTTALRLYGQLDLDLENRATEVRLKFNVGHSTVNWLEDKLNVERSAPLSAFAIYEPDGSYLDGSTLSSVYKVGFTEIGRRTLTTQTPVWETVGGRGEYHTRVVTMALTGSDGFPYLLRVGLPLDQIEFELLRLKTSIVTLVPLVLLIGGAAGWWLAGRSLKPVAEITRTAGRISASNLAERLPLSGTNDELDHLRAQLNLMIEGLQGSFEQMSQFLSNVSHELRTPLAALRGRSEVALRSAKTVDEFRELLIGNIEMNGRLAKTVSDMLVLARAEAGQTVLEYRPESLGELLQDTMESLRPIAEEKGINLNCKCEYDVVGEVDPTHTMRMILNLVDNAIKYNRPNGSVQLNLVQTDGWAKLSIADTGFGIPPSDLPHIFERFYRAPAELSGSAGGSGLGLGLAGWVATAHGGRIEVESEVGKGTAFHVWLPLKHRDPVRVETVLANIVPGRSNQQQPREMAGAARRRRTKMLNTIIKTAYWLGIFSGIVALVWRALVAIGLPERFVYGERAVGYSGFLNGAILFLLIACATSSYLSAQKD